jgi:cathepsin L
MATNLMFTLSPQQLVSCCPNPDHCGGTGGCYGSIPELVHAPRSSFASSFFIYLIRFFP